jgi:hypothetical protein
MTIQRAEQLEKLMQNVFDAIEEFEETIKKSDIKWAKRYYNSKNAEDNGDLECIAESLLNYGENLSDNGKNFNYNFS